MRKILVAILLLFVCVPAWSDGWNAFVEWKGWKISSNSQVYVDKHQISYPLTFMVDGNSRTAWACSGKPNLMELDMRGYLGTKQPAYHPQIEIKGNAIIDSIWIMNGYNRSPKLFARNSRVVNIGIDMDGRRIKTACLADRMGWHKVSVPRQRFSNLRIEFTGIRKGHDKDICISEIALYNVSRKIDFHLPTMVLFSSGAEVGEDGKFFVMSRSGKIVHSWDAETSYAWSPSRRRVASLDYQNRLFVVNLVSGRVIYNKRIRVRSKKDYTLGIDSVEWRGENEIVATICHPNGRYNKYGELADRYQVTTRLRKNTH